MSLIDQRRDLTDREIVRNKKLVSLEEKVEALQRLVSKLLNTVHDIDDYARYHAHDGHGAAPYKV